LFWFCPGSASISTRAPPSGIEVADSVNWIETVYVVCDGGVCDADSTASVDRGCSCLALLAVPLIPLSTSPGWPPRPPSSPTRPSLPFPLRSSLVVRLFLRVKWRSSTSTGVLGLLGASMLLKSVHESDGSASRTTSRRKNGRVVDDKLPSAGHGFQKQKNVHSTLWRQL
jgi:hypothetical protein